MLTLEPPYSSKNMVEIIRMAETASFTHPNETVSGRRIPEALVNIIIKAMAADKAKRFQTATELSQKIDDYIQGRNVSQLKAFKKGDLDNISSAGKKAVNEAITRIEQSLFKKFSF